MILTELDLDAARHICRNMRPRDAEEAFALRYDSDPHSLAFEAVISWGKYAFAARTDDGTPAAMIGGTETWPGRGLVWMLATDEFDKIQLSLTKWIIRVMIPQLYTDLGFHRFEAQSIATHEKAHRWMERLGAARETVLKGYGRNGEDFVTYVWTRESPAYVYRREDKAA